jgi:hypothetical protein
MEVKGLELDIEISESCHWKQSVEKLWQIHPSTALRIFNCAHEIFKCDYVAVSYGRSIEN